MKCFTNVWFYNDMDYKMIPQLGGRKIIVINNYFACWFVYVRVCWGGGGGACNDLRPGTFF